jgi:hypothetical protein
MHPIVYAFGVYCLCLVAPMGMLVWTYRPRKRSEADDA